MSTESIINVIGMIINFFFLVFNLWQMWIMHRQKQEDNSPYVIPHIIHLHDATSTLLCLQFTNASKGVAEDFSITINEEWKKQFSKISDISQGVSSWPSSLQHLYLIPNDSITLFMFCVPGPVFQQVEDVPLKVAITYVHTVFRNGKRIHTEEFEIPLKDLGCTLSNSSSITRVAQAMVKELHSISQRLVADKNV